MPQDEEHLRLLSIFHYIVGGLAALFSFFPLIYSGFGMLMLYASSHPQHQQGEPPPPVVGWLFIAFGCFFFLVGLALATCIALAGKFIARRRRYWFAFVTACVQCLFFPFGIILGVFTIIVLSRSSVKQLFGLYHVSALAALRTVLILRVLFTVVPSALGVAGGRMGSLSPPRGATGQIVGDVIFYALVLAVFAGLWFCRRWARTVYVVILALFVLALFARPQPVFASTTLFGFVLLQHVIDGVIIAMAYLPPLRERFTAKA